MFENLKCGLGKAYFRAACLRPQLKNLTKKSGLVMMENSASLIFNFILYNEFLKKLQDPRVHTFTSYSPADSKKIVPYICFFIALEEGGRPKNAFRVKIVLTTCISINGMGFQLKYVC